MPAITSLHTIFLQDSLTRAVGHTRHSDGVQQAEEVFPVCLVLFQVRPGQARPSHPLISLLLRAVLFARCKGRGVYSGVRLAS